MTEILINQAAITQNNPQAFKAPFLIALEVKKTTKHFISLEKPEFSNQHITTKGFFTENSEEEINKNYMEILKSTSKELYTEMSFPLSRVYYVKNLVYKAK